LVFYFDGGCLLNTFLKARQLDKNKCRVWGCGKNSNVEVHHIFPRSFRIIVEIWNLICVCPEHHKEITEGRLSNIKLLKDIIKRGDFRWGQALEWYLNREELKQIKSGNKTILKI